jgi:hypothetical protein
MSTELNADRARIYVSFADEDRARAMELVRWLNDSGWHVVADERHSFAPGETWSAPRRLRTCDVILCVITPGWLVSTYCHREFSWCAKRGKFVLPVICEGFDLDLLPPAIRVLPRIDFTGQWHDRLSRAQAGADPGRFPGQSRSAYRGPASSRSFASPPLALAVAGGGGIVGARGDHCRVGLAAALVGWAKRPSWAACPRARSHYGRCLGLGRTWARRASARLCPPYKLRRPALTPPCTRIRARCRNCRSI